MLPENGEPQPEAMPKDDGEVEAVGLRLLLAAERHQRVVLEAKLEEAQRLLQEQTRGEQQTREEEQEHQPSFVARPWRKILYKKQPYRDNHVPETFLEELVTNAQQRKPELGAYMTSTAAITQQMSAVAVFLVVFMYLGDDQLPAGALVAADITLLVGGYVLLAVTPGGGMGRQQVFETGELSGGLASALSAAASASGGSCGGMTAVSLGRCLVETVASFFLFLALLRIMAPVLRTLTVSYSDDSIYALVITLCATHVAFHDYSYANAKTTHFQGTVSLNAAMFATVLLASRLKTNESVFSLVLLAVELFAFLPMARHPIRRHSLLTHLSVTFVGVVAASALLALRDRTLLFAYLGSVLFVSLVCPLWLVSIENYKFHIQGPWDIASASPAAF